MNALQSWMTTNTGLVSNKGIVVAACIYHVLYGDIGSFHKFLSEYGLVYAAPGWAGETTLNPDANSLYWAQFSKYKSDIHDIFRIHEAGPRKSSINSLALCHAY